MTDLKKELTNHIGASLIVFLIIVLIELSHGGFAWSWMVRFGLGLAAGTFILDLDHLIYWFFLNPRLSESKKAKKLWTEAKFGKLIKLLEETHETHTSLVFHHIYFQTLLLALTLFVLSSTASPAGKGLVLGASVHLLVDQIKDFRTDYRHLSDWLFARTRLEKFLVPRNWLYGYIIFHIIVLGGAIGVFFY